MQREIHTLSSRIRKRKQLLQEGKKCTPFTPKRYQISSENECSRLKPYSKRKESCVSGDPAKQVPNPTRFYFGPTDSFGSFKSKGASQIGFGFNSFGLMTGVDHAFKNCGFGFVTEYSSLRAKQDKSSGHFGIKQIQGNIYGVALPSSVPELSIEAIVGYGYEWVDSYRNAGLRKAPIQARGKTNGMTVDTLLGVEYFFSHGKFGAIPENLFVTPLVNLQYIWSKIDEFSECNASTLNLQMLSQKAQSLRSTVGARFEYLVERKNFSFKPELDLGWQYEYLNTKRTIDFRTIGLSPAQLVSDSVVGPGRNTLLIGADFLFTICKVFELEMSYDFQWNNLYFHNTFYLGIGGNF
jgi:outer membrane autotransporter protein